MVLHSDLQRKWFPGAMAGFTLAIFFLVFHPVSPRGDYTTAVLAFCATLGWSAIILFTPHREESRRLLAHILLALCLALGALLAPAPFVRIPFWHWFLFGLLPVSFTGLYSFIRTHTAAVRACEE